MEVEIGAGGAGIDQGGFIGGVSLSRNIVKGYSLQHYYYYSPFLYLYRYNVKWCASLFGLYRGNW